MSKQYTADGRRRSSMAHAKHPHYFDCGKVVYGNGYATHRAAHGCRELSWTQYDAALAASSGPAKEPLDP